MILRFTGRHLRCCLLASASMALASSQVWAQQPAQPEPAAHVAPAASGAIGRDDESQVSIGVSVHYGALVNGPSPNPWSTGLGLGVGYTPIQTLHLGVNFDYFFGVGAPAGEQMLSTWQLGAEAGYDVGLGEHFVLRPSFGVGAAIFTTSYNGCNVGSSCPRQSEIDPLAAPGLALLFLNGHLVLSTSVRYALVLSDAARQACIFSVSIGGR